MKERGGRNSLFTFDRMVALISVLISLFLIRNEYNMPNPNIQQTIGPSFMPIAILVALIFSALLIFFASYKTERKTGDADAVQAEPPSKTSAGQYKIMGMVVLGLVLYGVMLIPVGFIISTSALIVWQAQLFQKGKWIRNLVVGIPFSIVVYYLFVHLLEVTLPGGILPF